MRNFSLKSLKSRIIFTVSISTLVIVTLITTVCYFSFQSILRDDLIQSTGFKLQLVMDNIDTNMNEIISIADWCRADNSISIYVTNAPNHVTPYFILNTFYRFKDRVTSSSGSPYIKRILISNDNYSLLQLDAPNSTLSDGKISREVSYFKELTEYNGYKWIGLVEDPFPPQSSKPFIPIIRIIPGTHNEPSGWVYIAVDPKIITTPLKNYQLPSDSDLYFTLGSKTYKIENGNLIEINPDYTIVKEEVIEKINKVNFLKVKAPNGQISHVVCYPSSNGLHLSQTLSLQQFTLQHHTYLFLLAFIGLVILLLGILLTYFFYKSINIPINRISLKLKKIAIGDFAYEPTIESDDEIGLIGKGINQLSQDILQLMDSKIANEQEKQALEFKMLQSQINPHFLYNTLNSIKWMATIQNATGIPEMTTALARLLKHISKGTNELISIDEEISLLQDYVLIQQYRYGGALTVHYHVSENVHDCIILKFTLQPFVENAIFHGIEPKSMQGTINIYVRSVDNQYLLVEIIDDGVGMTTEQINKILHNKTQSNQDGFSSFGIYNVNKRIKLTFGAEYGLSISSDLGKSTNMTLKLPYIKDSQSFNGGYFS